MQATIRSYWPVAAAIVCGFALLPPMSKHYRDWAETVAIQREQGMPVLQMAGRVVDRGQGYVVVHITGRKLRECRYAGLTAYTIDPQGVRFDAAIRREDLPQTGSTRPPGDYDIGRWRIWPTHADSRAVLVFADHLCAGVQVRSLVAEVPL